MKTKFNFRMLSLLLAGFLVSFTALAQTIVVKGHVQDTSGEPVSFGSVVVKGTTNGCNTDINGNFTLKCQKGATVQFSYVGYKTTTAAASDQMLVVMEDVSNSLNEAVVIGYGVAKKNDLTGSVTAIKPDEKNHGQITSAQEMMQGKIAGVSVNSSTGEPGAGSQIRIRGGSSLNASNEPLIVIDGLAMDAKDTKGAANPLSLVNPQDIETFTVLKDASATAIYGSRGSNGVIIITTKKGRNGQKPKFSYNGTFSAATTSKRLDLMNAKEYTQFIRDFYGETSDAYKNLGWIDPSDHSKGTYETDWQDEIYRTALSHDHNLTMTGGLKGEKASMPYRIGLGYTDQEGVMRTSDYERYTASINLSPSFLNDHLNFNLNGKFMHSSTNRGNGSALGAATQMDPTRPVRSNDAKYNCFGGYWQWASTYDYDPEFQYTFDTNAPKNPVALLNQYYKPEMANVYLGSADIDYKVHGFEDLRFHANFSGEYADGRERQDQSRYGNSGYYYGWKEFNTEYKYNLTTNVYAQYYKDFNEKHHFDVMAGYEWSHFKYKGHRNGYGTYPMSNTGVDELGNPLAGTIHNKPVVRKWASENYLVSWFGRANYTLLNRYLFTATVRYDGSSRLANHWALFPSFAFAWRIKDEKWLKDVDFVSDLKLRLGYGQTGQQEGLGDYDYLASYKISTSPNHTYPVYGDGVMYKPEAFNADLKWERTTTYNVGLDFGFFNGRLSGAMDYYYRKTTDLLNYASIPTGSNFNNRIWRNVGSLSNQGVEVSLNAKILQKNNWFWEISANLAYNQNKIIELTGDVNEIEAELTAGTDSPLTYHCIGHPANSFKVYQQVYGENGLPLEGVYVDRDGDGEITPNDRYYYKSVMAPWTAGISTRLQYKNWDLGLGFRGAFGGYVYNNNEYAYSNINMAYTGSYYNNIPKGVEKLGFMTYKNELSDYFVQNASFVKCDNITLGYSFEHLFKGGKYEGISGRLYASITNAFTITKYKGLDPEQVSGKESSCYPKPRTYLIGLNLNF